MSSKKHSYFEKQDKNQCAGYSSAYVLRCLGDDIGGNANYDRLGRKFDNGYVLPQGVTEMFAQSGHKATLFHGDLDSLKTRLMQGNPIIVLIGKGFSWQHYITVTGYDENNIYVYDSSKDTDNTKGYNRVLSNNEFLGQWNNGIWLFERIYFVVD